MPSCPRPKPLLPLIGLVAIALISVAPPTLADTPSPAAMTTAPAVAAPQTAGSAAAPSAAGLKVLAEAAKHRGTPYIYGGTTARGYDCSGFTQHVYSHLGISLPRTAQEQFDAVRHIPKKLALPGDLVFMGSPTAIGHVGIYAGHGMMWDSPHRGARVALRRIYTTSYRVGRALPDTSDLAAPSP